MLSVIILARNEADNLRELLPSLSFADEVLVIDDDSSDATDSICAMYGARRILHRLHQNYAAARNFGLDQIAKGWVLFLDADERISPENVAEIVRVIRKPTADGYIFRRDDVFLGRKLRFGDTASVRLLRLGKVGCGRWKGVVHETWEMPNTAEMTHPIMHYSHASVAELFSTIRGYAKIRARELYSNGWYWNVWQQVAYPPAKFLYLFLIKRGFIDGFPGLVMSLAMAWHSLLVRWYLWDLPWKERSSLLQSWRILMVMPILLLPLGQLLRGSIVPIYAHEIFMILAVAVTILMGYTTSKGYACLSRSHRLLIGLSAVFGISFLISVWRGYPWFGGMQLLRWYLYVGYLFSLLWGVSRRLDVSISGLISYLAVGMISFGWLQYIFLPDLRFLALLGWDDHYYRMAGSLFDPNFLGLVLVLSGLWGFGRLGKSMRWIWLGFAAAGIAATFSRLSLVVFGIVVIGHLIVVRKKMMALVLVALVAGLLALYPKPGGEGVNLMRYYSVANRLDSSRQAWALASQHPWTGIGFNQYGFVAGVDEGAFGVAYLPKSPDNSFLFVLVTAGIPGAVLFIWLLATWWQAYPQSFMRLSLLAILLHSLANNSFFYPFILLWWWLLLAFAKVEGQRE